MTESGTTAVASTGSTATKSEEQLWSEYLVAMARTVECWRLCEESWRNYLVANRVEIKLRVWERCVRLHGYWYDRTEAARTAWFIAAQKVYGEFV